MQTIRTNLSLHDDAQLTVTLKMAARYFLPSCIAFFSRNSIELLRIHS